ncbi:MULTISPECIES: glutamate ABC transporter substrate-binding protein [unclassified Pseudoclavibacter]|jgi:glutamate transport system substrate-binding protein|uniref:glutamate ABC transporter substrate-binding protein n=1 Tax=unclassified Pseudoclavibacter TaxID=2615177 RepID=UPI000CE8CC85|nr:MULTISPECIES: glutamate ABC transporter substrate-binding protein [unclassified Pseudoclavibacter]MBS3179490.1 glutamate ABC transporter substrate-binding protein [Pseudoclavibacter sp. Marseille-Q4354]NYF14689.1 glutamate transport system substrate-binding protein [Pseudoclavibacter sp. JAI123]PPG30682.1 ABC transporter substrate-binding protein [Pseudoclavibacter sp. RFBB5]
MRKTKLSAILGAGILASLVLTGCAEGAPPAAGGDEGTTTGEAPVFEVATDVAIEGSPTFDAIKARGDKVVVGVKEDQPNLGYLDAVTGERTGFDVDVARWMAASLGVSEENIEFKPIASANREQAISNGDIDYYVGTYSITDKRKDQIDFAGPYFETGQGLLVGADSEITGVDDLVAGVNVCSATGSTPIQNIRDNYPEVTTTEFDTYSQCVEALLNGQVDAVTTDEAILIGYAAQDPEQLKVVGEPFSEELYGIGLAKGDDALRDHFNTTLEEGGDVWQSIFDYNLGSSGTTVSQPAVDRY